VRSDTALKQVATNDLRRDAGDHLVTLFHGRDL
jgi:hypothetical protein